MIDISKQKKPMGLNEWAYQSIRFKIINNELPAGSQLNIEDLSKEFMISRTPIREALLRLVQDGLVHAASRIGFFVRGMTRGEFSDVNELRSIIESYATEQAALCMSQREIDELEEIHLEAISLISSHELNAFMEKDDEFHGIILNSLHNEKIRSTMESISSLIYRFRHYLDDPVELLSRISHEHGAIVSSIKRHDSAGARQAMADHMENNKIFLLHRIPFEKKGSTDEPN